MKQTVKARIPFERSLQYFIENGRGFKETHLCAMDFADRERWLQNPCAVLTALRIFCCGIYVEAKGHFWARKNHPEGILIYCIEGKGYYLQHGREWEIQQGDLLYCPPLSDHSYWADKNQPWTICWMHLCGKNLPVYERVLDLVENGPVHRIGVQEIVIQAFRRLVRQFKPEYNDARYFVIQANALHVLGAIAALAGNLGGPCAQNPGIQKILDWMDESLHTPFNLELFAKQAGYSPDYFTRLFKVATGMPPVRYFVRQKMHRACTLLEMSETSIKSIAFQLGYDDPMYFSRVFKKQLGLSPEAYRHQAALKSTPAT